MEKTNYQLQYRAPGGSSISINSSNTYKNELLPIRYRVHNVFDFTNAWNKRTNNNFSVSSAYTAHVTGTATEPNVKSLIQKLIKELQTKYGASTTLGNLNWDDIKDSIDKSSVSILKKYKDYAAEEIKTYKQNNSAETLTNLYNYSGTIATNVYNKLLTDAKVNDPLYARIESEELNENTNENENTLVRSIFLKVGSGYEADGKRPIVLFYEGPDRALEEAYDTGEIGGTVTNPKAKYPYMTLRNPQPVIVVLENDFKGILFIPNSPVAIVGNGHKFEGFVVAEKFVKLLTSPTNTYTKATTQNGVNIYVDKWGNVGVEEIQLGDTNYMRRPEGIEIPYNAYIKDKGLSEQYIDFNSYINGKYQSYTNIDVNNLKHYEWVIDANATFGLSAASHYDHFNIPELYRGVYTTLNPDDSKDMFFTTARSKWIT